MKKFLSLALVLSMIFCVFALAGCSSNKGTSSGKVDPNKNIYADLEGFDSYVPADSAIIATWKMTSPDTDKEWQFFANTTLHQSTITDGISRSTICTYNYDGEGTLKVYGLSQSFEDEYTVTIENNILTLTAKDNSKLTFEKK